VKIFSDTEPVRGSKKVGDRCTRPYYSLSQCTRMCTIRMIHYGEGGEDEGKGDKRVRYDAPSQPSLIAFPNRSTLPKDCVKSGGHKLFHSISLHPNKKVYWKIVVVQFMNSWIEYYPIG